MDIVVVVFASLMLFAGLGGALVWLVERLPDIADPLLAIVLIFILYQKPALGITIIVVAASWIGFRGSRLIEVKGPYLQAYEELKTGLLLAVAALGGILAFLARAGGHY